MVTLLLMVGWAMFAGAPAASARELGPNVITISGGKATIAWKDHPDTTGLPITIKVKGNSSSKWPKKSYGITFPEAVSLYGMPADTEWRLSANYHDRSLLRNKVAFDLAQQMSGLAWTPHTEFVEFQLNGKYLGSYLLTESIKIAPDRVDITGPGAQIVEFDRKGKYVFTDSGRMVDSLVAPKSTVNSAATKQKVNTFLDYLKTPGKPWADLIDRDSFVDYYLVREFTKDNDADFVYSNFWHTNSSSPTDPIVMGPVWDFDRSAGNEVSKSKIASPMYWWMRGGGSHEPSNSRHWYVALTKSPVFREWLCARWTEKRDVFEHVHDVGVTSAREALGTVAATNDTALWAKGKDRPPKRGTGYTGEVDYLTHWYDARFAWMDANICS